MCIKDTSGLGAPYTAGVFFMGGVEGYIHKKTFPFQITFERGRLIFLLIHNGFQILHRKSAT